MKNNLRHQTKAEINVVPYIDVMLVLLIIFMVTTPLMFQGVDVDLPQAANSALKKQDEDPVVLSIDRQNHYYLNFTNEPAAVLTAGRVVVEVTNYLAAHRSNLPPVLIKGDKNLKYADVVTAMTLLKRAGAANIGLVTTND